MTKPVKVPHAVRRMMRGNQTLCCENSPEGLRWWLEPSKGTVGPVSAQRAIRSGLIEPLDMGLFGREPQSYRLREEG